VTLSLARGWNLISLPLAPATLPDAQTLLTGLAPQTQAGYTEIDAYGNGRFAPSLFDDLSDGIGVGGSDFTLQLGHGYALYTDSPASLTLSGVPVTAAAPLTLAPGWNLVGFPDAGATPYTAFEVLRTLLAASHGSYAELDAYSGGTFSPSAFDDPGDGIGLHGSDFPIQPGQGYALYTDAGVTLNL
jgi:hypothetical protein